MTASRDLVETLRQIAFCSATALPLVAVIASSCSAQIFGQRTLGRPLTSRVEAASRADAAPLVGVPFGSVALPGQDRGSSNFIGRSLRVDQTFVGRSDGVPLELATAARQELERARAVESRRRRTTNANVVQIQQGGQAAGPTYPPRLEVGFDYPAVASASADRRAEQAIQGLMAAPDFRGVAVSVSAGNATLRGVVASDEARKLAEAVVNLEPGVSVVANEVQVR